MLRGVFLIEIWFCRAGSAGVFFVGRLSLPANVGRFPAAAASRAAEAKNTTRHFERGRKRDLVMTMPTCAELVALCFVVLCGCRQCHVLIGSTGVFYKTRGKTSITNNEDNQ